MSIMSPLLWGVVRRHRPGQSGGDFHCDLNSVVDLYVEGKA